MKLQRNDYLESAYQMLLEEELRPGERDSRREVFKVRALSCSLPRSRRLELLLHIYFSVYISPLYVFFTLKLPISIHRRFTDCKSS